MREKEIGIQLLECVMKLAKEGYCTEISLMVNEKNTSAIRVYEKMGMKVKNIAYNLKLDD